MVMFSLSFFCVVAGGIVFLGFLLGVSRLLNCLIMLENLNVMLLFLCLWGQAEEFRILFLVLMVIFTVEVSLSLVVLSRVWRSSELEVFVGG